MVLAGLAPNDVPLDLMLKRILVQTLAVRPGPADFLLDILGQTPTLLL
jgi:hypothetical protein